MCPLSEQPYEKHQVAINVRSCSIGQVRYPAIGSVYDADCKPALHALSHSVKLHYVSGYDMI